ncbi:uncharacterized protein LOC115219895 [Octopus sinensis]|uniref:Uncharacterized protein LOC115219895 n=1 Tax=Octopus sinensis TaxID=2607531 RepID=A0A6P7T729_9MOLL|nr:uncharacterized protein LOC115219895 [Octopus sinensis]
MLNETPMFPKGILFHEHFTKSRTVIQILAMEQKTDWQAPVTVLFWIILQLLSFRLMFPTSKTIAFPMNSPGSLGLCFLPALIEIIILLTIIKMEIPKHSKAILEGAIIGYFSHFFAIFFENYLNTYPLHTKSNVVLIFISLQPFLSLILDKLFFGIILPAVQIVAVLILTIGALGISFFTGSSTQLNQIDVTMGMAVVVLFICRNIAMKQIYIENIDLHTRCKTKIIAFLVTLFLLLGIIGSVYAPSMKLDFFKILMATYVHTVLTILMLTNFLKKHTTVMVAIFSMLSQFLCQTDVKDILLLFRNVKLFLLLLLCVCGVIIYIMSTYKFTEESEFTVRRNDRYTRLEFTMFIVIILALLFYFLPPKVSSRDIKNFKYLGFNSVLHIF